MHVLRPLDSCKDVMFTAKKSPPTTLQLTTQSTENNRETVMNRRAAFIMMAGKFDVILLFFEASNT